MCSLTMSKHEINLILTEEKNNPQLKTNTKTPLIKKQI